MRTVVVVVAVVVRPQAGDCCRGVCMGARIDFTIRHRLDTDCSLVAAYCGQKDTGFEITVGSSSSSSGGSAR